MCSLEFDIAHRELVVSCLLAPSFQAIDRRVSRECSCQSLWIDGSNQSINRVEEKPWKNPPIGHHRLWHSKKVGSALGLRFYDAQHGDNNELHSSFRQGYDQNTFMTTD